MNPYGGISMLLSEGPDLLCCHSFGTRPCAIAVMRFEIELKKCGIGITNSESTQVYVVFEREAREFHSYYVFMFQ